MYARLHAFLNKVELQQPISIHVPNQTKANACQIRKPGAVGSEYEVHLAWPKLRLVQSLSEPSGSATEGTYRFEDPGITGAARQRPKDIREDVWCQLEQSVCLETGASSSPSRPRQRSLLLPGLMAIQSSHDDLYIIISDNIYNYIYMYITI